MRIKREGEFSDNEGFNPFDKCLSGVVGSLFHERQGNCGKGQWGNQKKQCILTRGHGVESALSLFPAKRTASVNLTRTKWDNTPKAPK